MVEGREVREEIRFWHTEFGRQPLPSQLNRSHGIAPWERLREREKSKPWRARTSCWPKKWSELKSHGQAMTNDRPLIFPRARLGKRPTRQKGWKEGSNEKSAQPAWEPSEGAWENRDIAWRFVDQENTTGEKVTFRNSEAQPPPMHSVSNGTSKSMAKSSLWKPSATWVTWLDSYLTHIFLLQFTSTPSWSTQKESYYVINLLFIIIELNFWELKGKLY